MDRKSSTGPDYEREIEELINIIIRMSSLAQGMSTAKEQEQMEGKKAVFIIKGLDKRYVFEVIGTTVRRTENMDKVTTYCYISSSKVFLETVDKIIAGDGTAFQRGIQRGDIIMKGAQSFHDQLMWKKVFDRFASFRKVYGAIS